MKQTRRLRQGAGALLLALAAALAPAAQGQAQTVTAVMQSGLRVLDPVMTTAFMTRDHGYMIYDTLLGTDEHFKVQPQMASWTESEDRKTYVFTLRDGLKWHDGAPVTSEDCIASIKRWADADATGQVLMTLIDRIEAVDAKQFRVVLKQPTSLLLEGLAKLSSRPLFMMPKRIADTPSAQPITEFIGSGPFKFVASEFKPGLKVVYENKDYVPRAEPPSWTAGGKVVKVERVEWVAMPDQMTAVSALQNGEVDFMQQVPFDLLPMVEARTTCRSACWTSWGLDLLPHEPSVPALRQQAAATGGHRRRQPGGRAQGAGGQPQVLPDLRGRDGLRQSHGRQLRRGLGGAGAHRPRPGAAQGSRL